MEIIVLLYIGEKKKSATDFVSICLKSAKKL